MRQGLFAVVLVLAAFAGGAIINGPGMAWVQDRVHGVLAGGPAPSSDDASGDPSLVPVEVEEGVPEAAATKPAASPPMDPPAPFEFDVAGRDQAVVPTNGSPDPPPTVSAPRGPTTIAVPLEPRPSPPASDSAPTPGPEELLAAPEAPAPLAGQTSPPGGGPWADVPDSAPAAAVLPDPVGGSTIDAQLARAASRPEAANPLPAASSDPGEDLAAWQALQRQMMDLGVTRYWFEGEVGGRARYRCLIPVVGDQVVSQHIEAEGPTVFDAAQAALRRVALWRAAHEP